MVKERRLVKAALLAACLSVAATAIPVPALAQGAAIVGTYGMGLLAVAVFAAPALLLVREPGDRRPAAMTGGLILVVLAGVGLWGALRLEAHPTVMVPGVKLRLVQAAIDQKEKWRGGMKAQHLRTHLDLTRGPGFDTITDVIWPETAVGYYPQQEAEVAVRVGVPRIRRDRRAVRRLRAVEVLPHGLQQDAEVGVRRGMPRIRRIKTLFAFWWNWSVSKRAIAYG